MIARAHRNQFWATMSANLLAVGFGGAAGWPSASFLALQSDESPLESGPLTVAEMSWVGSLLCVGAIFGNIVFGLISDRLGRKVPLLLAGLFQLISWILIIIASSPEFLYVSRFLSGLSGGGLFVLVPMFVTEISDDSIRGFLGSLMVLSFNIGVLIAFTLGNFCGYYVTLYVSALLPILFAVVFIWMPETPPFLMKSGEFKKAETSLRFYRNITEAKALRDESFHHILRELGSKTEKVDQRLTWSDINNPVARKALLIGVCLMALNQFCGCFAMLNYTATIFAEAGSDLTPTAAAIVIGAIQLAGSYFSSLLVEKAGRKLLLTCSAFGTGVGLLCLGTYTYLKSINYPLDGFGCLPIVSFSGVIFIASCGVLNLPFLVIAELMSEKIRSFGISVCTTVLWCFAFIIVKGFPALKDSIGMHGSMFLFAFCSWSGALFILLVQPETKGRSLEEITVLLGGSSV